MTNSKVVKSTGRPKPPNAGMGRPAGVPNKSTSAARMAIAKFVDNNSDQIQDWLEKVANGVQDKETKKWLVPPNPKDAFMMFQALVEYHVPKLARQELVGDETQPVRHVYTWKKTTSK